MSGVEIESESDWPTRMRELYRKRLKLGEKLWDLEQRNPFIPPQNINPNEIRRTREAIEKIDAELEPIREEMLKEWELTAEARTSASLFPSPAQRAPYLSPIETTPIAQQANTLRIFDKIHQGLLEKRPARGTDHENEKAIRQVEKNIQDTQQKLLNEIQKFSPAAAAEVQALRESIKNFEETLQAIEAGLAAHPDVEVAEGRDRYAEQLQKEKEALTKLLGQAAEAQAKSQEESQARLPAAPAGEACSVSDLRSVHGGAGSEKAAVAGFPIPDIAPVQAPGFQAHVRQATVYITPMPEPARPHALITPMPEPARPHASITPIPAPVKTVLAKTKAQAPKTSQRSTASQAIQGHQNLPEPRSLVSVNLYGPMPQARAIDSIAASNARQAESQQSVTPSVLDLIREASVPHAVAAVMAGALTMAVFKSPAAASVAVTGVLGILSVRPASASHFSPAPVCREVALSLPRATNCLGRVATTTAATSLARTEAMGNAMTTLNRASAQSEAARATYDIRQQSLMASEIRGTRSTCLDRVARDYSSAVTFGQVLASRSDHNARGGNGSYSSGGGRHSSSSSGGVSTRDCGSSHGGRR